MSDTKQNVLIGKTVTAIYISMDKEALRFDVEGGDPIIARTEGDCCSYSWVESLDFPEQILGSPVLSVDDIEMPDLGDLPDHDVMSYYGCKITTARGCCVIDYRNDSNGYYGGWIDWPGNGYSKPSQDVSKDKWEKLA